MLRIKNLSLNIDSHHILRGVTLDLDAGETHVVMGPNGSGKTSLAYVLAGREDYGPEPGCVLFNGVDLADLEAHERALAGIHLSFQNSVEIPGLTAMALLRESHLAHCAHRKEEPLSSAEFLRHIRKLAEKAGLSDAMLRRPFNLGLSGGEKKRMELLQIMLLAPPLVIFDETDAGLDRDALHCVVDCLRARRAAGLANIVITHFNRLLDDVDIDHIHIILEGKICHTGDRSILENIEKQGYTPYEAA